MPSHAVYLMGVSPHKNPKHVFASEVYKEDFAKWTTRLGIPDIDFYSSISQSKLKLESRTIAENSTEVCCHRVDFPATVETVFDAGAKIFIELGANATCTNWIKTILKDKERAKDHPDPLPDDFQILSD